MMSTAQPAGFTSDLSGSGKCAKCKLRHCTCGSDRMDNLFKKQQVYHKSKQKVQQKAPQQGFHFGDLSNSASPSHGQPWPQVGIKKNKENFNTTGSPFRFNKSKFKTESFHMESGKEKIFHANQQQAQAQSQSQPAPSTSINSEVKFGDPSPFQKKTEKPFRANRQAQPQAQPQPAASASLNSGFKFEDPSPFQKKTEKIFHANKQQAQPQTQAQPAASTSINSEFKFGDPSPFQKKTEKKNHANKQQAKPQPQPQPAASTSINSEFKFEDCSSPFKKKTESIPSQFRFETPVKTTSFDFDSPADKIPRHNGSATVTNETPKKKRVVLGSTSASITPRQSAQSRKAEFIFSGSKPTTFKTFDDHAGREKQSTTTENDSGYSTSNKAGVPKNNQTEKKFSSPSTTFFDLNRKSTSTFTSASDSRLRNATHVFQKSPHSTMGDAFGKTSKTSGSSYIFNAAPSSNNKVRDQNSYTPTTQKSSNLNMFNTAPKSTDDSREPLDSTKDAPFIFTPSRKNVEDPVQPASGNINWHIFSTTPNYNDGIRDQVDSTGKSTFEHSIFEPSPSHTFSYNSKKATPTSTTPMFTASTSTTASTNPNSNSKSVPFTTKPSTSYNPSSTTPFSSKFSFSNEDLKFSSGKENSSMKSKSEFSFHAKNAPTHAFKASSSSKLSKEELWNTHRGHKSKLKSHQLRKAHVNKKQNVQGLNKDKQKPEQAEPMDIDDNKVGNPSKEKKNSKPDKMSFKTSGFSDELDNLQSSFHCGYMKSTLDDVIYGEEEGNEVLRNDPCNQEKTQSANLRSNNNNNKPTEDGPIDFSRHNIDVTNIELPASDDENFDSSDDDNKKNEDSTVTPPILQETYQKVRRVASEIPSHNRPSHPPLQRNESEHSSVSEMKRDLAEKSRSEGISFFKAGKYDLAIQSFTNAIESYECEENCKTTHISNCGENDLPIIHTNSATYYNNRAQCYLKLNLLENAESDWKTALEINPRYVKAYLFLADVRIKLGKLARAQISYGKAKAVIEKSNDTQHTEYLESKIAALQTLLSYSETIKNAVASGSGFEDAIELCDKLIKICDHCVRFKVKRVILMRMGGNIVDALEEIKNISDSYQFQSIVWKEHGNCLYYYYKCNELNSFVQSVSSFYTTSDRRDFQDLTKVNKKAKLLEAKKGEANEYHRQGDYKSAIQVYSQCLTMDAKNMMFNAIIYRNRAASKYEIKEYEDCIEDCEMSIKTNPDQSTPTFVKAQILCCKAMRNLNKVEDAIKKSFALFDKYPNDEGVKSLHQDIKKHQQILRDKVTSDTEHKMKNQTHYDILELRYDADDKAIKKAYRVKALMWHPDKHANKTEKERAEADVRFKRLQQAYNVLSDEKARRDYDREQRYARASEYSSYNKQSNSAYYSFHNYQNHQGPGHGQRGGFSNPRRTQNNRRSRRPN